MSSNTFVLNVTNCGFLTDSKAQEKRSETTTATVRDLKWLKGLSLKHFQS